LLLSVALGLLALLGALQAMPASKTDPWYAKRAYYGWFGCLAAGTGQTLRPGQSVLVFARDLRPKDLRIAVAVRGTDEWPYQEAEFEVDCSGKFKHAQPDWVASLRASGPLYRDALYQEALFAIAPPSAGLLPVGGKRKRMAAEESRRLVKSLGSALPAKYRGPKVLVHGYRYGPESGHEAVELYLGLPTLSAAGVAPPIKAISIRRVTLVDGRPLAAEEYTRESGVEERVDSGEIELTRENWSVSETAYTIGFLSRDGGASWDRLSVDWGFEGIWWRSQSLRDGLPLLFEVNMYTSH
jgi:hypothetical protein